MGLRGRSGLPAGTGLLLVFPIEGDVCITAEGVAFATEVLFARARGEVTAAERFAADDARVVCAPARVVLEVEAGALDAEGIECTLELVDVPLPPL